LLWGSFLLEAAVFSFTEDTDYSFFFDWATSCLAVPADATWDSGVFSFFVSCFLGASYLFWATSTGFFGAISLTSDTTAVSVCFLDSLSFFYLDYSASASY